MIQLSSTCLSTGMTVVPSIQVAPSVAWRCVARDLEWGRACSNPSRAAPTHLTCSRSVNVPWPEPGMGDADYLYAFQTIIMPIAYEFAPDLVISESHQCIHNAVNANLLYSLCWLRRCCRRPAGDVQRHPDWICAYDIYVVESCRRQVLCCPRGTSCTFVCTTPLK